MSTDFRAETADPRTHDGERGDAPPDSERANVDAPPTPDRTDVDARLRAVERAFDTAHSTDDHRTTDDHGTTADNRWTDDVDHHPSDEPAHTPERDPTPNANERAAADVDRALAARLATVERRLDDLDAAVQSLQGYVGSVDAVNESVERRANAALAAAERPRPTHPLPDLPEPEAPDSEGDDDPGFFGRLLR